MKKLIAVFCSAVVLIQPSLLLAAEIGSSAADVTSKRSSDTTEFYQRDKELNDIKPAAETPVVTSSAEPEAQMPSMTHTVTVKKITTNKSGILTEAEIRAITSRYENRDVTLADLRAAAEEINGLYREKKQVAARAFVPPQKITGGVVEIRLVEGRVGDITVENNRATKADYFKKRIHVEKNELVDLDKLEDQLFLFNRTNDVRLRAVLRPGVSFGTTDYVLNADEPAAHEGVVYVDNAGRENIGLERIGMRYTQKSLLGIRDRLSFGGILAAGTQEGSASYDMPVNTYGTRLGVSADTSRVSIKYGELKSLKIEGYSSDVGMYATHPLVVERDLGVNAFLGFNGKRSSTQYDDFTVLAEKVRTATAGLDLQGVAGTVSWDSSQYFKHGFDKWHAQDRFLVYTGEARFLVELPEQWDALVRAKLQIADSDLLPSSEQISVGGVSSVRGYQEGVLLGDNGYVFNFEIGRPLTEKIRGIMFLDTGGLQHQRALATNHNKLTGAGAGLNVAFSKDCTGRVIVGVPLAGHPDHSRYDPVVHFDVQYKF